MRCTLLLVLGLLAISTVRSQPTTGLVAHWPFTGNANDASGNGNHGVFTSGSPDFDIAEPDLIKDRFGQSARAYWFNGVDHGIRVPHSAELNFGRNFTVSFWVRRCGAPYFQPIIAKMPSQEHRGRYGGTDNLVDDTLGFGLAFSDPTTTFGWFYASPHTPYVDNLTAGYGTIECGTSLIQEDNRWHHVAYVVDLDQQQASLYFDNVLQCSTLDTVDYDRSKNRNDIHIGFRGDWYRRLYSGLDDIRLYNRALTTAEINALYTEGGWPQTAEDRDVHLSVAALGDTAICPGGSVSLSVSHQADSLWWNRLAGVENPDSPSPTLSPSVTTTYEINAFRVIYGEPCPDTTFEKTEVTVVVREPPTIENNAVYRCLGGSSEIGVSLNGGEGPYRWEWSPSTGLDDATRRRPVVEVTESQEYRAIVTDRWGCRDTAFVQISVLEPPTVEILRLFGSDTVRSDTVYYCRGSSGVELSVSAIGPEPRYRYLWQDSTGLDRGDSSHVTASPDEPTSYAVRVVDGGGICARYDTVVVVPVDPPVVDAGDDQRICIGGSVLLGTDENDPDLIYEWRPSASLDDASVARPTAAPNETTTYYVRVTDPRTECSSIDSVVVTVDRVDLSTTTSSLDFGTLDGCRTDTLLRIPVTNGGPSQARLTELESSTGTVSLFGTPTTIDEGEASEIIVRFAPSIAGDYTGRLVLRFGPCNDSLVVDYTGSRSESNISIDRGSLDFGRLADCEVGSLLDSIIVTNNGTDIARLQPGLITAPFSVVSPTLPFDLAAGEQVTVIIDYAPAGAGTFSEELRLPYRSGACSDTLRVLLDGEVYEPELTSDVPSVDFGLLDGCSTESEMVVDLRNEGSDDLSVTALLLPQGVSALNTPATVAGTSSDELRLRWVPSSTGQLTGVARIVYGPCNDTLSIDLSGEKRGVSFELPDSLDLGEVCVGSEGSATFTITLDSEGTGDGSITAASIDGPFASSVAAGIALSDGTPRSFMVTFTPTVNGTITGELLVRLDPCDIERRIVIIGTGSTVDLAVTQVDFGPQPISTSQTQTVIYENRGTTPLRITSLDEGPFFGSVFHVLSTSPPLPVDLAPGESLEVEVRFDVVGGASRTTLGAVVEGACDTTVRVNIFGTGESSALARISVPDLELAPGEESTLRIVLDEGSGLEAAGAGQFRATIAVEPSLLTVTDATSWQVVGGERQIEIVGRYESGNPLLAEVPVIAMLGRVESSSLQIVDAEFVQTATPIAIDGTDGELRLQGLCREGGVRLFDPSGEIGIKSIVPNPVRSEATIRYSIVEPGEHTLVLVDLGGRIVERSFSGLLIPGEYIVPISTADLPSGQYRAILRSPTLRVDYPFFIVD